MHGQIVLPYCIKCTGKKATKDITNGRWKLQNVDLVSRVTCMKYKKCVMKKKKILLLIGLLVTLKDKVSAF